MKKIVLAAVLLASAALPAAAQESKTPWQNMEENRRQHRVEVERQYEAAKRAREKSVAETGKVDPWAGVRETEKPAKKPEKKTAKKPPPARAATQ